MKDPCSVGTIFFILTVMDTQTYTGDKTVQNACTHTNTSINEYK
jgi:hypothetical protein